MLSPLPGFERAVFIKFLGDQRVESTHAVLRFVFVPRNEVTRGSKFLYSSESALDNIPAYVGLTLELSS